MKLFIIAADRISEWIDKGAFVARYYNPGDLFDEVHIVLLNKENPNPKAIQKMVGRARFKFHRFSTGIPHFIATGGWDVRLLKIWAKRFVDLAEEIQPDLIRCHWGFLNAFAAKEIKEKLGIPYVVSLHANIDTDIRTNLSFLKKVRDHRFQKFEREVLASSDRVLPVYEAIVPYLNRLGVQNYEVAPNVISPGNIHIKENYELGSPVRIVCVGRHYKLKNPEVILRSLAHIPHAELDLYGTGEYHQYLKELTADLGLVNRVRFIPAIPNEELCRLLPSYDIFAAHMNQWGLSKANLEAFLTGLPCLMNRSSAGHPPEQPGDTCLFVEDSIEGFKNGITKLIQDSNYRKNLGERGRQFAQSHFSPEVCENRYRRVYSELLENRARL